MSYQPAVQSTQDYLHDCNTSYTHQFVATRQINARPSGFVVSFRQLRYLTPLVVFALGLAGDIYTTITGVQSHATQEGDPIFIWLFSHFSLVSIVAPLVLGIPFSVWALKFAGRRNFRLLAIGLCALLYLAGLRHGLQTWDNTLLNIHTGARL